MDKQESEKYMDNTNATHLEPRVARLETGLETLTRNVSEMAVSIRENATNTNQKIDSLIVAVTQAQAPKKTDWGLFISAIGLILALGAAVLIPLNNATNDNKSRMEAYHESMVEHQKMDMHPVGWAKVQALDQKYDRAQLDMVERDKSLDIKIQKEYQLMNETVKAEIVALDLRLQREFMLVNDRNGARLDKIESRNKNRDDLDQEELRSWRSKANGLSTPASVVPLIPTQLPVVPALK